MLSLKNLHPAAVRTALVIAALAGMIVTTAVQGPPAVAATAPAFPKLDFGKPVPGTSVAAITGRNTPKSSDTVSENQSALPGPGDYLVNTPTGGHDSVSTKKAKGAKSASLAGGWQGMGSSGLHVAAAKAAGETPAAQLHVQVLSQKAVKKDHLSGLAIRITRADSSSAATAAAVQVPDAMLAGLYGADYASRVRWVQVPATQTTSPAAVTAAAQPVATTVDTATQSLVVTPQVTDTATVLTAVAGPVSSTGTGSFAATPLKPSDSWDVSAQTGDFSWQYPMRTPPAAAGPAPSVGLSYDSQSVDGETGSTNNQPSAVGEGWSLTGGGFIERSYVSCSQDDGSSGPVTTSGDLCWKTDNATISVAGHSGTLVKDSTTGVWKLQSDDGTRFEHLVGAANGCGAANGTYDDDCWRMTTTDGTQYYFGMNELPGWASGKATTNSAWTVPVFGNDTGEPCHASTFAASSCVQAWRWNLDYVVDVHGNAEALYYDAETNKYAKDGTGATAYTRGGQLAHIDYGLRSNNIFGTNAYSDTVVFGYDTYGRCSDAAHTNCTSEPITSAAVAPAHPTYYPDVPFDQLCTAASCSTAQVSPTFFTDGMLDTVTTKALIGTAYQTVDTWTLSHSFPSPGDTTNAALWMTKVVHQGSAAGQTSISEPATVFTGATMQNRVWVVDGLAPLDKYRITSIQTSLGAVISVNYSGQQCTPANAATIEAAAATNTNWCFPQWWTPQVTPPQAAQEDLFHKYVVTSVVSSPQTGGTLDQPQITSYTYGTPRWRYNNSPLIPNKNRTWDVYAGVDTVQIRVGSDPASQQVTDYTYYQGMDGDRAGTSGGTKSVDVKGTSIPDALWFAGQVYEQKTLDGVGGAVLSDTINTPWAGDVTSNDGVNTARLTAVSNTVTTQPTSTGGNRTLETKTTFDPTYGLPLTVSSIPSDATPACTTTTYTTPNTAAWIIGLPKEVQKLGVSCANSGTATLPDDLVSDTRTYYDGDSLGTVGAHGDVTSTQEVDSYSGSTPHWVTNSTTTYDALGRPTMFTDVLGHTTTTAYTPATTGPLTSETVTNTAPFSWPTTTVYNPEWGAETSVTDPNGNLTTATYDALGRRVGVWLPQHTQSANPSAPSIAYAYTLSQTAANVVTTSTLATASTVKQFDFYDGLGQQVQTQKAAEGSGTQVSGTAYDTAGRPYWVDNPYWTTSVNPSTTLFKPASEVAIPSQQVTTYDTSGRPVTVVLNSAGIVQSETDTTYVGADRVDTVPPTGGTPSSSYTNALGQQVKLTQYLSSGISGTAQNTTYTYDKAGQMASMTDPAGNTWSWNYNLLGQQAQAIDPDTGTTTTSYDDAGNTLTSTDGRGQELAYTYDALNRKTGQYDGTSSAGSLLASWSYDTVQKGQLTSSTSYTGSTPGAPGLAYTTTIGGYDAAGSPTKSTVSIPVGAPAFGGTSYTTSYTYNVDETPNTQVDPAEGGLPSETLRYAYDSLGNMTGLRGSTAILSSIVYTPLGQVGAYERASAHDAESAYGYDLATGAVIGIKDTMADGTVLDTVNDREYTRDPAGNITSTTTTSTAPDTTTQVDCYSYDHLQELTQVWTPGTATTCADTPSVSNLGGPASLWDTYTYDTTTGNRTGETVHATSSEGTDTTATYSYPAAGAAKPHAVGAVTGVGAAGVGTYGYDQAGNTITRPGQTLSYDAAGKLSAVATSGGTQRNVYDASGSLLLQLDPIQGASLHLGDTVLNEQPASSQITGVRTYAAHGAPVAERSSTPAATTTLKWLFVDVDGTVDAQADATTGSTEHIYRDPFGAGLMGSSGIWGDGNGYLNKSAALDTGLVSIGARFYDTALGRFETVDPVFSAANPKQDNGYAYALNSPITSSDPTGQDPMPLGCETVTCRNNSYSGSWNASAPGEATSAPSNPDYVPPAYQPVQVSPHVYMAPNDPHMKSMEQAYAWASQQVRFPVTSGTQELNVWGIACSANFKACDPRFLDEVVNPANEFLAESPQFAGAARGDDWVIGAGSLIEVAAAAAVASGAKGAGGGQNSLAETEGEATGLLGDPGDVVVLGRQADTAVAKGWSGHVVLDTPNWSLDLNDAFIRGAIAQQRTIYLASPFKGNLVQTEGAFAGQPTVFARELEMLRGAGYSLDGDYMVPAE